MRKLLKIKLKRSCRPSYGYIIRNIRSWLAFGIDLDKCFDEVQRSNMSKLGEDGKPIYNENGKVMKGPKYFEPNLKKFVD